MKIATILAVGWHLNTHKQAKKAKHLSSAFENYKKMTSTTWPENQSITDVTANIFSVLN